MAATPGQIVTLTLQSQALGCAKQVNIYLPPGYATSEQRYPVICLLRGHEREWLNPTEDDSRQPGSTAATVADELIAAGLIPPVMLVMPGVTSEDNAVHSMGLDMRAPEKAEGRPGVGTGRFGAFLVDELFPAIDRDYRTRADRAHRAIDGFSLGGFLALSLALRHPEIFCSVGAFDGTFLYAAATRPDGEPDGLAHNAFLAAALGEPLDLEYYRSVNPVDLVRALPPEALQSLAFHIESAPEEAEPMANFYRTQHLLGALAEKGVTNSFAPPVLPGSAHKWVWADEHLRRTLVRHAAVFTAVR